LARSVALGALCCLALTCLAVAFADEPPTAPPPPGQWIAPLPDDVDGALGEDWVEERMGEWVVWPSEDDVRARGPLRDRRAEFPEITSGLHAGPGAVSPDEARADAAAWARRVLKPELAPEDLDSRFVLLQDDDPSRSSVLCRFETNGTGIQICQLRWALCAVIRPDPAVIKGLAPEAIGPAVFRAAFTKGDEMAGERSDEIEGLPYHTRSFANAATPFWWGWFLWYSDGRSVAVYARRSEKGPRPARAGDPWF